MTTLLYDPDLEALQAEAEYNRKRGRQVEITKVENTYCLTITSEGEYGDFEWRAMTKRRQYLLDDLKDAENRRLFYKEHIVTGLPFQIRELRKKRKMTQKHMSEITGFSQPKLSDYENPKYEYTPQIGTLMRLADAFDVPLIVRFGSWDEIWDWETRLSPKKLAPQTFDEALPKLEKAVAKKKKE